MAASFNFKLDPSSLPKLASRGENYTEWRNSWTIAFRYATLLNIVNGKSTRPAAEAEAAAWDTQNDKALVMILSSVHSDLTLNVASCDTAAEAWKFLAGRFDRDTGSSSIQLFRLLTNLRYRDGDDLRSHIDHFHTLWTRMSKRCAGSSHSVAKSMAPVFSSDEVKGSFFLTTLPDTMDHIVDNLSTRDLTSFAAIEPKLLDLAEKHTLDVDSSAYAATRSQQNGNQQSRRAGAQPSLSRPKTTWSSTRTNSGTPTECTWCRKHNFTFVGHIFTECNRLREHKERTKKGKTGKDAGPNKKAKSNNARETITISDGEDSDMEINAFTASAGVINSHGKRLRE